MIATSRTTNTKPTITQAMLQRLMELRQLHKEEANLRGEIIRLHQAGAKVEPGQLDMRVVIKEYCMATWDALERVLDKEEMDFVRSNIEPSYRKHVEITKRYVPRSPKLQVRNEWGYDKSMEWVDEEGLAD